MLKADPDMQDLGMQELEIQTCLDNNFGNLEDVNLSGPLIGMEVFDNIWPAMRAAAGLEEATLDAADASELLSRPQPPLPTQYCPVSRRGPPERKVMAGSLNFHVEINASDTHKRKYLYSSKLNCIYVNMKTCFSVQYRWDVDRSPRPMYVRATVVFSDEAQAEKRVERCTQHIHEPSNANLSENIIRNVLHSAREMSTAGVYYCGQPEHADSWYSVVVEFPTVSPGPYTHAYQFGCKNSCTSGINRRSIAIIFELEDSTGLVYGRQYVGARACACPRRDINRDEAAVPATKRPITTPQPTLQQATKKVKLEVVPTASGDVITLPQVEIVGVKAVIAGLSAMLASMEYDLSQNRNDPQAVEKYTSRITTLKTHIEQYKNMKP